MRISRPLHVALAACCLLLLWLLAPPAARAGGQAPTCSNLSGIQLEAGEAYRFPPPCSDPENDPLTFTIVTPPQHGTLTGPDASGLFTYTPEASYRGPDSLQLKAGDGTSESNTATISGTVVEPTNDAPQCFASVQDDDQSAPGTQVEAGEPSRGFLTCFDEEGAERTLSTVDAPDHGTLSELTSVPGVPGNRTFTYTPEADYRGADSFSFKANDGAQDSAPAVVNVTVIAARNDAPQCFASISAPGTNEGGPNPDVEAGEPTSSFISCFDDEGDDMTLAISDPPDHGSLPQPTKSSGGGPNSSFWTATYTPESAYRGTDAFAFKANDGASDSPEARVTVDVIAPRNDAPRCSTFLTDDDTSTPGTQVEAGEPESGSVSCYDDEGDPLTLSVADQPDKGTLSSLTNPGGPPPGSFTYRTFTYTANADATGNDSFAIKANDGTSDSALATVQVEIVAANNDAPQCSAFVYTGGPGGPGTPGTQQVEQGDSVSGFVSCTDDEGQSVAVSIATQPNKGTLSLQPPSGGGRGESFTYAAPTDSTGPVSFAFKGNDGTSDSAAATVQLEVVPVRNDPPQCFISVRSEGFVFGERPKVEAGEPAPGSIRCFDDEDENLTYTVSDPPEHGALSALSGEAGNGFRSFTYTPAADYRGADSFSITVTDSENEVVKTAEVEVIEPTDAPPVCLGALSGDDGEGDEVEVEAGESVNGFIFCSDDEGEALSFSVATAPTKGSLSALTVDAARQPNDRSFTYTATAGAEGLDTFEIEASDGSASDRVTYRVRVRAQVNDPPECFGTTRQVRAGSSLKLAPACRDDEGTPLTFTATDPPNGTVAGPGADGQFTYTPDRGFSGEDSFTYTASDGTSSSQPATVRVFVDAADPIIISPPEDTPEVNRTHSVLVTVQDAGGDPRPNRRIRWRIEGVGSPIVGDAQTNASGQATIDWSRSAEGADTLTVFVDEDDDGTPDTGEPEKQGSARWRATRDVDPPAAGTPTNPNGDAVNVPITTTIDPSNPAERYFSVSRSQTSAAGLGPCPGAGSDSRLMNLPVSVPIEPGSGTVKPGSVSLFLVDPGAPDTSSPLRPPGTLAPTSVEGTSYRFVVDCVRTADMYVRYTLVQDGVEETFTVPIGGLVLIDPQGVVYDKAQFDAARAAGKSEEQARAEAAITGAEATLQRKVGDEWRTVLSGDPGISPHVNPQTTGADGKFQWDVSAGIYRVVVRKDGYDTVTSRETTIPPPELALHVEMQRTGGGVVTPPVVPPPVVSPPPVVRPPVVLPPPVVPPPVPPKGCKSLKAKAKATCELNAEIAKKCGKLKGSKKSICIRKVKALAKCKPLKGKKKKACVSQANRIGSKKGKKG